MKQIRPTPTSEPHLVPPNVQPRERRAVRCGERERDSGVDDSGESTEADCRCQRVHENRRSRQDECSKRDLRNMQGVGLKRVSACRGGTIFVRVGGGGRW